MKGELGETVVGELGRGEIAGEMAIVSGEPRTGTVYAVRDTQVATLSRESFRKLLYRHPETVFSIVTNKIVQRLRNELSRTGPVHESISTIAVVPASADVDLDAFCTEFAKSLSEHGRVCHLSRERADAQLGNRGLSQSSENSRQNLRLVEWLGKLESEYRFVVYQTESVPSEWTKRCLRQADRVLLVANAAANTTPGRVEAELLSEYHPVTSARRLLVLLHQDPSKEPTGTRAWLQSRKVEHHYHVRLMATGDIDRLARHVIGCATGLVLGGGFARGMVHIGVIRALQDLGIPIDAIGGNSMGALIAAEYTIGWNLERMLRDTAKGCAACISGMTLPMVAFKTGGDYSDLVCHFVGNRQIEDLWLPYFCVSANLNRAELKVHTEGPLAKAILASSRVPGVFPPIVYDGEMHVDGGVLNNVPVDVMRGITQSGVVIGVDAVPSRQFDLIEDYGLELNGWRTAVRRWNPFRRRNNHALPHIIQIMLRTIEFGGTTFKRANSQIADLYLAPPLRAFKPTDFVNAEAIRDIGYEYTIQQATEWLATVATKTGKKAFVAVNNSAVLR
jgi:predicted acylesterase/phospholipase RssA